MIDFENVKQEDAELLEDLEKNRDIIAHSPAAFREKILRLMWKITQVAGLTNCVDDYRWLQAAATRWRKTASSVLGTPLPQIFQVPMPQSLSSPRTEKVWLKSNFDDWLEYKAWEIFRRRAISRYCGKSEEEILAETPSTGEEHEKDWHAARIYLASDVLDGKLDFVRDFDTESYQLLEGDCWLRDVKQVRAFLRSQRHSGRSDEEAAVRDFTDTCSEIRDRAINQEIKASQSAFEIVSRYLQMKYLDRLDQNTWDLKPTGIDDLIETKARRVWELTGNASSTENWTVAETYVREFYLNILPAVSGEDDSSTTKIVDLLQLSNSADRLDLVNCFEAAIVIYFLNASRINGILQRHEPLAVAA
jgi:hypothetical protein